MFAFRDLLGGRSKKAHREIKDSDHDPEFGSAANRSAKVVSDHIFQNLILGQTNEGLSGPAPLRRSDPYLGLGRQTCYGRPELEPIFEPTREKTRTPWNLSEKAAAVK